jgi:hypothetical protein
MRCSGDCHVAEGCAKALFDRVFRTPLGTNASSVPRAGSSQRGYTAEAEDSTTFAANLVDVFTASSIAKVVVK